jgi:PiT family inorganic phosphate transporter
MGVGSAERLSAVKWGKAKDIVGAWFLTIPVSMALGALFTIMIRFFM